MNKDNFLLRETDTTLLEKDVRKNLKRAKRKVISDKEVTPRLFDLLIGKVYYNVQNPDDIKQKDIIEILYDLNISNTTIARVINYLIPTAKATQGSVASMIRFLKVKEDKSMVNALINQLESELN